MQSSYEHTNSKGKVYQLNSKEVTLRGNQVRTIYYFSKDYRSATSSVMPEGYKVTENMKNGFLTLSKVR